MGEKARERTGMWCPSSEWRSFPLGQSKTATTPVYVLQANRRPSQLHATASTNTAASELADGSEPPSGDFRGTCKELSSCQVAVFQTLTVPLPPAATASDWP